MQTAIKTFVAVGALFLAATSCSANNGATATNNPPPITPIQPPSTATTYQQIERLATPALKEATENYLDHDATNRSNPYVEAATNGVLVTDAVAFLTSPQGANRSAGVATAIGKVLFPDVMLADISQTGTAAYLGVQSGGLTSSTGSKFGGRGLTDDVIDADLGAIFGATITQVLKLAPEDSKESPCLTTDNVPGPNNTNGFTGNTTAIGAAKNQTTTFPYVGAPYTS